MVKFVGVFILILTKWLPFPIPLRLIIPLFLILNIVPDCVPVGIFNFTTPSTVSISIGRGSKLKINIKPPKEKKDPLYMKAGNTKKDE